MSQIKTNQKLANSFADLKDCSDSHNCQTKSKIKDLLDIPLFNTQIYGRQAVKYNSIKDSNNFRNNSANLFPHQCTYTLVKKLHDHCLLFIIYSYFLKYSYYCYWHHSHYRQTVCMYICECNACVYIWVHVHTKSRFLLNFCRNNLLKPTLLSNYEILFHDFNAFLLTGLDSI